MPGDGPGDPARAMLRAAVRDDATLNRYWAKVKAVSGSDCLWWDSAVSGRGHGRFWVGTAGGRDVVLIAHRFGWAAAFGVDALDRAPVLGHRCDNPLCQRLWPGHVVASSPGENRQEWARRRHTLGGPLRDSRGARGRARALRDALRADPTGAGLHAAAFDGLRLDAAQLPLWGDPPVLAPAAAAPHW